MEIDRKSSKGVAMNNLEPKDIWIYRMIIGALGLTLVASIGGAIALELAGQSTPEVLVALGSAAIGGLAGFLVPTHPNR
jgi:hypothetical protein